jgi:hypothetical protein
MAAFDASGKTAIVTGGGSGPSKYRKSTVDIETN